MNLNELVKQFQEKGKQSSEKNYRSIIKNYIVYMGEDMGVEIALTSNKTKAFILNIGDNKIIQKYEAIRHLYNFYYDILIKAEPSKKLPFPIEKKELPEEEKGKTNKKQVTFLSRKFNLSEFLDDKHYEHLNNKKIALMCRAAIGLAIATAYKGGYIVPSNTKEKYTLNVEDVHFEDDKCVVPNLYKENAFIYIDGKIRDILYEYYNERIQAKITKSGQENHFIAELESYSRFNINPEAAENKSKPYGKHQIISYILKYICYKNNEEFISLDHIRHNVIYHSLIQSRGTSLNEIIEIFGIKDPFIIESINHYHKETLNSKLSKPVYVINSELDEENENEKVYLKKKLRDRDKKKVRYLKELYDYKCQVCNEQITLLDSIKYCEVHHLRPLGNDHQGPDETYNMLVVCPNHHVLFDLGVLVIDPSNPKLLLHTDSTNKLHLQKINLNHDLDVQSLRYAYSHIFLEGSTKSLYD